MATDPRIARFVEEYTLDWNGTQAALRAGYSPNGVRVQASRMLARPNIQAAIKRKQAELAKRVEIRREDIVRGLLETIKLARSQGDAQAMIKAAAELAKLLGFYPSDKRRTEALSGSDGDDLRSLSDAQLLALIKGQGSENTAEE